MAGSGKALKVLLQARPVGTLKGGERDKGAEVSLLLQRAPLRPQLPSLGPLEVHAACSEQF